MKRACRTPLSESPTREEEMKRSVRKLRLGRLASAIALVVLLTGLGSSPVEAKQPTNASPLLGTWVNTKTTGGLAKVVITDVSGDFEVHPYGFCSPTFCDWGMRKSARNPAPNRTGHGSPQTAVDRSRPRQYGSAAFWSVQLLWLFVSV